MSLPVRLGRAPRPPALARSLRATGAARNTQRSPLDDHKAPVPPQEPRRAWFFTVYRIANFAVIPFAAVYCVFFADFGDHEHIFSPARRWMDEQRREFSSLSSEELELARSDNKGSSSGEATSRSASS